MMIGTTISHFKILEKLGEGGMGVVYKAEDKKLKRTVALKFLPPELTRDPEAKERFIQEAQAASGIDHPNICTIYEINETADGQLFIVMACYEGQTLKQKVGSEQLAFGSAIDIAIQVAQGLQEAHSKGIVHRDIKPANIMITSKGQVKIMDFGLAKLKGQIRLTKEGTTVGTGAYMSPEQARGEQVDHRSDIWSLGIVLYEMLTGHLPFKGEYDQAVVYSILNEEPKKVTAFRSDLQTEWDRIISKTLKKNPSERYQTISDLETDIRSLKAPLEREKGESTRAKFSKRRRFYFACGLIALVIMMILAKIFLFKAPEAAIDSIAVLPFQNLSADPEQEYFSDGMTDALIAELSKIKALRVISRTSVMRYKKAEKPLPQIAKELNVTAIVEGSVQRAQDEMRITAQLIRAVPEKHLWANSFTKDFKNILALESEVAQAIAKEINITMTAEEQERLASSRPVNPEAYELYLKGRFFISKFNEADVRKGISYFEEAIAKDSSYALAYEGLAEGYDYLWSMGAMPPEDAFPKIKGWARKALSLDEALAEAYAVIGDIESAEWNWQGAEEDFKRAIGLTQNCATAHAFYAGYLLWTKRDDEALSEIKRALEVDPMSLLSKFTLAWIYMYRQESDSAMTQINEALSIDSSFIWGYLVLGQWHMLKGNFEEAIEQFQKTVARGDSSALAAVAYAQALSGNVMRAREILADLKTRYVPPGNLAMVYIGLEERDRAFECLQRAYEEHDQSLLNIISMPDGFYADLDSFRADPRFKTFVHRMGLEQ